MYNDHSLTWCKNVVLQRNEKCGWKSVILNVCICSSSKHEGHSFTNWHTEWRATVIEQVFNRSESTRWGSSQSEHCSQCSYNAGIVCDLFVITVFYCIMVQRYVTGIREKVSIKGALLPSIRSLVVDKQWWCKEWNFFIKVMQQRWQLYLKTCSRRQQLRPQCCHLENSTKHNVVWHPTDADTWWTRQNNAVLDSGPFASLSENTTLSTKPKIHNLLHCHQRTTESQPQSTCTENLVKFGCGSRDMQMDRHINMLITLPTHRG